MYDDQETRQRVAAFLQHSLEQTLEPHRQTLPDITVELGDLERHAPFISAIAELLGREEARGTKGMSGVHQDLEGIAQQVEAALEQGTAMVVRAGDELIGYATVADWNLEEGALLEFCSAVVDDTFRGQGFGRLLVDAREVMAATHFGEHQPIAFCNRNSIRIYNRELWFEMPWEWYRRYPVPVVCKPECQQDRSACDCTVIAMDLERLQTLAEGWAEAVGFAVPPDDALDRDDDEGNEDDDFEEEDDDDFEEDDGDDFEEDDDEGDDGDDFEELDEDEDDDFADDDDED